MAGGLVGPWWALLVPTMVLLHRCGAGRRWTSRSMGAYGVAATTVLHAVLVWRVPPHHAHSRGGAGRGSSPTGRDGPSRAATTGPLVLPAYPTGIVGLAAVAAATGQWAALVRAVLAAVVLGVVFLLAAVAANGRLGLGDASSPG